MRKGSLGGCDMSPKEVEARPSREFTRGEKCLFTHLVVSVVLILVVTIVYFCHLCVVPHRTSEAFRYSRRSAGDGSEDSSSAQHTGALVLRLPKSEDPDSEGGGRVVCGCVALRPLWSVAPALCVAARSDPAIAEYLPAWVVRYRSDKGRVLESGIARGIVHSHFHRDDAGNNIGLLEHSRALRVANYRFIDKSADDEFIYEQAPRLAVAGWRAGAPATPGDPVMLRYAASPVDWEKCRSHMSPITELRSYEFCAMIAVKSAVFPPPPGSALVAGSDVLGFFSWGDKHGSLPLVALKLISFKPWIEGIVSS